MLLDQTNLLFVTNHFPEDDPSTKYQDFTSLNLAVNPWCILSLTGKATNL